MKILIFSIAYHPFIGGAEIAIKEITDRLPNFEFHLLTVNLDGKQKKFERVGNVSVYRIGKGKIGKYLFPILAFFKALNLHVKHKFNATWSIMANYAGFAALLFKLKKPHIPFILTLQEGDSPTHIKKRVGIFMPLYKKIFSKADEIHAISNFLAQYAKDMSYKKEAIVIPNGVDVNKFNLPAGEVGNQNSKIKIEELRKELGLKIEEKVIITSSRLVKKNAVDQIIESLKYLPENYKLLIAGIGEEEKHLKLQVQSLKLEARVLFLGFVSHDKLPLFLKVCDIFVRPSRSEGLGNSFIEAMAAGLPVIGTAVGGITDFLFDPEKTPNKPPTGLFCDVDNPQSIAKVAKRLIDDTKLRESIIKNAKDNVSKNYDWNIVTQRITLEIFNKIKC